VTIRKLAATLPRTAAPLASGRPRLVYARDEASGAEWKPTRPPRLLIVEDDFLVALAAEAALRDAGFEITGVVGSAEEAIARATAQRPSLVIMDVRLSGRRDGIEAAIELFRDHGIPCIFATAHADAAARERAAPAKARGWLQKPYVMPELVALVREAIESREYDD